MHVNIIFYLFAFAVSKILNIKNIYDSICDARDLTQTKQILWMK